MCRSLLSFWVIVLSALLVHCDDGEGEDEGGNGGGSGGDESSYAIGQLAISSTNAASSALSLQNKSTINSCSAQLDITRYEGVCLTPIDVWGQADFVEAVDASNSATIDDRARMMSVSSSTDVEGSPVKNGGQFQLTNSNSFSGQNELFQVYSNQPVYNHVVIESTFLRVKFAAKNQFVTMLLVTRPQPFLDASIVNTGECALSDSVKQQSRFQNLDTFEGISVERGDYLFCLKDNATDECQNTDYQWFDTDSNQLVSTRPAAPRVNRFLTFDEITCSREGEDNYQFSIPLIKFIASLTSEFSLYADFTHGINSNQWPDSIGPFGNDPDPEFSSDDGFETPYVLYYYQPKNGQVTEGTDLSVNVEFDLADMLMVPGLTEAEYDAATLEQVLAVIDTKSNIGFDAIGGRSQVGYNESELVSAPATASVTLAGGRDRPSL